MAVLWRSNENKAAPDARYRETGEASPAVTGVAGQKNTFLEKHLRICDPMPSEAEMKQAVKNIFDARKQNNSVLVPSVSGPSKPKQELYGKIKPPANSTYFIGLAGFQETNAWIEANVLTSDKHAEVPILGNGTVVTYDGVTYTVVKAGKIRLSIAVGAEAQFVARSDGIEGAKLSMASKIVYHWGGVVTPFDEAWADLANIAV